MNRCPKCDRYAGQYHTCHAFLVWRPDYGEEPEDMLPVYAADAEEAAERWAEDDDSASADYSIVGGRDATVMVQDEDGEQTKWIVSGEAVPTYTAREVSP